MPDGTSNLSVIEAAPKGDLAFTPYPASIAEHAGDGTIGRKTAWALSAAFILLICAPGGYQYYYDTHVLGRSEFNDLVERPPTADSLQRFESDLRDQSRFDRWVRHSYWKIQAGIGKAPASTTIGFDHFLFPQFEMGIYNSYDLSARTSFPASTLLPALIDYDSQLRKRGIHLVVFPIPVKACIYPEKVAIDYRAEDGPAYPPGYLDWLSRVRAAGIDVLDITQLLWREKGDGTDPVYLPADVHWSYRGRAIACDALADHVLPLLAGIPRMDFSTQPFTVDQEGDMAHWISSGWGATEYPRIHYQCSRVVRNGAVYVAGDEAPVLILGDSFTAIGNSDGYGFANELMLRFHIPVQALGVMGDPLDLPRKMLMQRPGALANKKVVIWEFSQRFLWTEWNKMPLPPANSHQ